jgi:serine/threonine protein kinase
MATKINVGGFGSIFKVCIGNSYAILKVVPHRHGIVCNILELILYFSKCPHIVQAYEYELDNTCYKILMPPALYDLSKAKRVGKSFVVKQILQEIALAVEYLHKRHIVHGDIKPSNILIYKEGTKYTAKLTDFSLARLCNEKINGIAYTIGYRAPEIETLKIYTFKSDIWALGETFKVLKDIFPELKIELFDNLVKGMCTVSLDKRFDIYDVLRHPYFKTPGYDIADVNSPMACKSVADVNPLLACKSIADVNSPGYVAISIEDVNPLMACKTIEDVNSPGYVAISIADVNPLMNREVIADVNPLMNREVIADVNPLMNREVIADVNPLMNREVIAEFYPLDKILFLSRKIDIPIQVITDKILEQQNSPHSLIDFFREKVF